MPSQALAQHLARAAGPAGGLAEVVTGLVEELAQIPSIDLAPHGGERTPGQRLERRRSQRIEGQVAPLDAIARGVDQRAIEHLAKLANVVGPRVAGQRLQGLGVQVHGRSAGPVEHDLDQGQQIVGTVPQRHHLEHPVGPSLGQRRVQATLSP